MRKVYLDNAATTPLRKEVVAAMHDALKDVYGNPSSTHSFGRSSKTLIERARKTIAKQLNAHPSEIIFTSGGTEADNMILQTAVRDLNIKTIITAETEHHAVLHTIHYLEANFDINVLYVNLEADGTPSLEHLEVLLKADDTKKMVSIMHVNNEIGNMIPIREFAHLCKSHDALFHSDTVQSIGHWEWDVKDTPVDFLTAAAHKFHGPKGVGFAYIRKDTGLKPLIFGGEQERGHRAGTESSHNIVGLEKAFTMAYEKLHEERDYISALKTYFISEIEKSFPDVTFNGSCKDSDKSTYTLINISLPLEAQKEQILLFHLDINGIAASKGSACQSGAAGGSHVISAISPKEAHSLYSLRFSFSPFNTKEEIDYVIKVLMEFKNK